jgi:hypothetical protein
LDRTIFSLCKKNDKSNIVIPEGDQNKGKGKKEHKQKIYLKYFDVIPSIYFPEMIKMVQYTMKNSTSSEYKDLLNKKMTKYTEAHIKKSSVEKEKLEDPDLNFIGLPTYDIRVN